ncbi:MAG: phage holin family protein [Burkholderiales bacterium]|nr:phage holin family protein [Burkholderiales bacterium]
MSTPAGGEGLFASLKTLAATLVAMGKTRLELLSTEIAVEKARLMRQLIVAQLFVFFLMLAIVFGAWWLVLLFEAWRVGLVGTLGLAFLLAALLCARWLVQSSRQSPPPLADTLAELEEDLAQLRSAAGHDQPKRS